MNQKVKLLIVGASNKSTRSIARSLKKYNCEIYVLSDVDLAVSKSRHIFQYIFRPGISRDIVLYRNEILKTIAEHRIDVVLPSSDMAIDVSMRFQQEIGQQASLIGLNTPETYAYAHNKYHLLLAAKALGLNVPAHLYVDDISDIEKRIGELTYPVVVKPVSSARIIGDAVFGYKVSIAKNERELLNTLRELVPSTPVMVQEYIEGYGIGYNVFCIGGEVKSEYIHKRLNENGGVSSYRSIIPIDSFGIRERVHALLRETGWNGVAMVEFKVDLTGVPYLMEMNGRFFGSTELGVKAGYDFPGFLYSAFHLKEPAIVFNTGRYLTLRFLHDEVLLEYHALLKTKKIGRFLKWKLSLLNALLPGNYIEDNLFNDPKFVVQLYLYDLKRARSKRRLKKQLAAIVPKPLSREIFEKAGSVAFVCFGNICRSPFAAVYAASLFPEKIITSTGTHLIRGRFSPLEAVGIAHSKGVDLSRHQSTFLQPEDIPATDLFIVMDKRNYFDLLQKGVPEEKVFFLSAEEIADPYNKGIHAFDTAYTLITQQLQQLKSDQL